MRLFPLPAPEDGGWLAGRLINAWIPLRHFSPSWPFTTTEKKKKELTTLAGHVCNLESLQEINIIILNVLKKKSAINFQWYFCLLSVLYMLFLLPAPPPLNTSGPGQKYMLSAIG